MTVVKSALLLAGATALALPLYAQNSNNDSEVYYIDGVEYRPFVPDSQRQPAQPAQGQNPQGQNQQPAQSAQPSGTQGTSTSVSPGGTPYVMPERTETADASASSSSKSSSSKTPPPLEKRVRYGSAVIQALDKVTAETMRFEVPVGKSVRYKG
ncbi:MAG: hypothetical protein QM645_09055, partial [Asticcacaulis sp.]